MTTPKRHRPQPTPVPLDALLDAIRGSRGLYSVICAKLAPYARPLTTRVGKGKISPTMLRRLLDDHPAAREVLWEEREKLKDAAEAVIFHHLGEKNLGAAQWYLQVQAPERGYAPPSRHAVEVQGQVQHTHVVVPQEQVYDALALLDSLYGTPAPARLAPPALGAQDPVHPPARAPLGAPTLHRDPVRGGSGGG